MYEEQTRPPQALRILRITETNELPRGWRTSPVLSAFTNITICSLAHVFKIHPVNTKRSESVVLVLGVEECVASDSRLWLLSWKTLKERAGNKILVLWR